MIYFFIYFSEKCYYDQAYSKFSRGLCKFVYLLFSQKPLKYSTGSFPHIHSAITYMPGSCWNSWADATGTNHDSVCLINATISSTKHVQSETPTYARQSPVKNIIHTSPINDKTKCTYAY